MSYVDGFVLAVPTANREKYRQMAVTTGQMFKGYGATALVECWGSDVPDGKETSFPMAVKLQPDETVVFAWLVWPSKEARDQGHEKMKADPACEAISKDMPFDGMRMIFGGFETIVDMSFD